MIAEFARRYGNHNTRRQYEQELHDLFRSAGVVHPRQLSETHVLAWAGERRLANNTKRNRLSRACTFLRWCVRQGEADPALVEALASRDNPLRRTPRLYGKKQGTYPARWLTHEQAFAQLVATCASGSDLDLRDELVLRLGLAGMRAAEIIRLRVGDIRLTHDDPSIDWIGKASRPRNLVPGRRLRDALADYFARYTAALGRELRTDDPVICREKTGTGRGNVSWGNRIAQTCSVRRIVLLRATAANLGHMSPHDLRRTAAGILHHATDDAGAHHFDLLDIQKVLGHADPATTMRSYLDPMDNAVQRKASRYLD